MGCGTGSRLEVRKSTGKKLVGGNRYRKRGGGLIVMSIGMGNDERRGQVVKRGGRYSDLKTYCTVRYRDVVD